MNLKSPPFPAQKFMDDHRLPDPIRSYHSSSMTSCHYFFKSCQDQTEDYYDRCEFGQLKGQPDGNYAFNVGGSSSCMMKDRDESDLELSLWKKEDQGHGQTTAKHTISNKWMSSKMRLMEKIKNPPDRTTLKLTTALTTKIEDQKLHLTTQPETDQLISCNNSLHNNSQIRVCSDCNTTKTPLWRSGPNGPKSLCNACGIRQRKARRAMAAAAAAANGNGNGCSAAIGTNKPQIKVHREKTERKLGRQPQTKKRCKAAAAAHVSGPGRLPPNNGLQKRRFEDLLINLSKKLAIHRIFPEDEKDAAILLMALSYGLVHG